MDSSSVESNQNNQNNQYTTQKKRGGSQKRSWVWEWFISNDRIATCQVEVITGETCGKKYQHGSSTGILIDHLSSKHQITRETTKQNYVVRNKIK
jgi:hypothetical protein